MMISSTRKRARKLRNDYMKVNPFCHYCHIPLVIETGCITRKHDNYGSGYATIDHKHPKSRGGTLSRGNTVLCCYACNCEKNNRYTYDEFMKLKSTVRIANDRMYR